MSEDGHHRRYWRRNLILIGVLLAIWAIAGFVLPIFLVGPLNAISLGGFKLGFWFAQQGSILVFIALILVYAVLADRLDREFHVEERKRDGGDS